MRRTIANSPTLTTLKEQVPRHQLPLSQLPLFLSETHTFDVPVYAVWGACEDVQVLEKLRSGEYKVKNLNILDESHSRLLEVGGIKLRLLGLGGAVVMHKLFDNGEGRTTIAGGQGTMWTTLLQMGELVDTANRTYDPSETRVFVTHASPAREGLLNQLAVALKADFSISGGLHFRYGSSYNEFSVNPTLDHFRGKLAASKASFQDVWETVKSEVEPIVAENEAHQKLLNNALDVVEKMPSVANGSNPFGGHVGPSTGQIDEAAFKNMWNFNLADAAFGYLVLDIESGRIGTEMRALGFNFAHRGMKATQHIADSLKSTTGVPSPASIPPPTGPQAHAPSALQQATGTQQQQNYQSRAGQPQRSQDVRQQGPPQTRQSQPAPANATGAASGAAASSAAPTAPATNGTAAGAESKANGINPPAPSRDTVPKSTPPPPEPSKGIFVENVTSDEEVRKLFSEADQAKIVSVEKRGREKPNWAVNFESHEVMLAVFDGASSELKNHSNRDKPRIKHLNPQTSRYSNFGVSGGYKSGQSDSETGRGGRGGSFRGRGGRGGDSGRGGRGRGGGRGGFNKDGPTNASPAPAPAATGGS